ncbi:insulinase family protein [Pseudomonas sp. GV071]|uniref:insulinase family protein n=1 Tax=Pseudomonas sp. GV071 TaxID=2135754 RepID=UPI000D37BE89|nr:insulinase family protein [Pseudomonas sp. GV071]PTQ68188.1 secreted Zn-dependent insulinase-like peptidase [Pseudomonas sp. GV071]
MSQPAVLRAFFTLALLLPCTGSFAALNADLITYPKDQNQYRSVRLANNMDVMLVHSAGATHAAANVTVQAGSAQNPEDLPGLAHFTEHMVFLGSERFADPNGYSTFMSKVGGNFNANTETDFTNYYFRVPQAALGEALQRLSATLAVPLFDVSYVDRERHAVDAEYRMRMDDDRFRLMDVLGEIINPTHPMAQFQMGNLTTLGGDPQVLRQRVSEFHQRYYSANLMKLVVSGPQSLDELQAYVNDSFALMTDRRLPVPATDQVLERPGLFPGELQIKSIKPNNELSFLFVVGNAPSDRSNNTLAFLLRLLNNKDPGGLQHRLKQEGLAQNVGAGMARSRANQSIVTIEVAVPIGQTPDFARIQATVFGYLDEIRKKGLQDWRYQETANLTRQRFEQKRPSDPLEHVRLIAINSREYPTQDWLYGPYRMEHFDAARATEILDAMTPARLLRVWLSPDAVTDKTSKWFAGPYRFQPITHWPEATPIAGLALPGTNRFTADDMRVLNVKADRPALAVDSTGMKVWYRPEHQFNSPKSVWKIELQSPAPASPKEQVRLRLFASWLQEVLAPAAQQAGQAGLGAELSTSLNGLWIELSGLRQRQPMLLGEILDGVARRPISPEEYQRVATRLKLSLQRQEGKSPTQNVGEALGVAIYPTAWLPAEKLAALEQMSLQDLEKWRGDWLKQLHVRALAVGNLAPEDVQQVAHLLTEHLHPTLAASAVPPFPPRDLAADLPVLHQQTDSQDHSMQLYWPHPQKTPEARADTLLLAQLIKSRYFQSLRTEQQLGYAVGGSAGWNSGVASLSFSVQSHGYSSDVLRERTQTYLQQMDALVASLAPQTLAAASKALVANVRARRSSVDNMASGYWTDIKAGDYTFGSRKRLAKTLAARTPEQVQAAWKQMRRAPTLWVVADPGVAATLASFKRTPTQLLAPEQVIQGNEVAGAAQGSDGK